MDKLSRRTFLKKTAAASGAALTGGLYLGGCAPAYNKGAKRTLQFWAFSDTRTAWQEKAWELYKKEKKPDFDLNFLILPYSQMHDKVMVTSQAGSGGPDIADIEIGQFGRFTKGDVIFVDLTPRLAQLGVLDKLYRGSATDPWSYGGKVYGLGNELNAVLLSYRWEFWEKAGLKTPIETWDDFVEQAQKYHKDTGKYLIDFPFDDSGTFFNMTLQQGVGFLGKDGRPTLDTSEGARTLSYQQAALKAGWSIRRPSGQAYNAALQSGDVASLLGPSWNFSGFVQQNIPETEGKWRLQPVPVWDDKSAPTSTQGGTGVAVLKTSSLIDEAMDFVIWEHTTTEAVMFDFEERQVWPTWRPAFENQKLTDPIKFFDNQRVGELIEKVSPEINTQYNGPFYPETSDALLRKGVTPAILTSLPAKDALSQAQAEAEKIINFESA